MRKVKRDIAVSLLTALHECHLASDMEDNDLPLSAFVTSYNRIGEALTAIGYPLAVETHRKTGSLEMALEAL